MELYTLLLEIAGGGLTGYLTNSLAIKMLFKSYGPFGGVILKTRDQFIDQISTLVENDLVNAQTLDQELIKPEVQQTLSKIMSDFLSTTIYQASNNLKVDDLAAIGKTLANYRSYYHNNKERYLMKLFSPLFADISAEDILTPGQLDYLARQAVTLLITRVKAGDLEIFLKDYLNKNKGVKLSNIIPVTLLEKLKYNISAQIKLLPDQLEDFAEKIAAYLDSLWTTLGLTELFHELQNFLTGKTIEEVIGEDLTARINSRLKDKLLNFIDQNPALLNDISAMLLNALRNSNIPLDQLFSEKKLTTLFSEYINPFFEDLAEWLKSHREELGGKIDLAITASLEDKSGEGGWQSGIKRFIYEQFRGGLSGQGIISGLIDDLEEGQLAENLEELIADFLKNYDTGMFVNTLEEKELLTPEILTGLLQNYLQQDPFRDIFKTDCRKLPLLKLEEGEFKRIILKEIKENFISNPLARDFFLSLIKDQLDIISELTPEDLLPERSITGLNQFISGYLDHNQEEISHNLKRGFDKFLKGKKPGHFTRVFIPVIGHLSERFLDDSLNKIKRKNIDHFVYPLSSRIRSIGQNDLPDSLLQLIRKNLPAIMGGRIKAIISSNLSQIPDRDVKEVIESFMGNELKPLTYFGALLGLLAGSLLFLTRGLTGAGYNLPLSILIYGLTGYLTNIIAIRMIFRPYKEKRLFGLKLPLTPGVITREKPRFVRALGNFIDRELLNNERLVQTFREKREVLQKYTIDKMAQKDYYLLQRELKARSGLLARYLVEHLDKYLLKAFAKTGQSVKLPRLTGVFRKYLRQNRQYLQKETVSLFKEFIDSGSQISWFKENMLELIKSKVSNSVDNLLIKLAVKIKTPDEGVELHLPANLDYDLLINKIIKVLPGKVMPYFFSKTLSSLSLLTGLIPGPDKLLLQGVNYLSEHRDWVKEKILKYSQDKLGLWYTAGRVLNIEETITSTSEYLLDYTLPEIFSEYREELSQLLNNSLIRIKSLDNIPEEHHFQLEAAAVNALAGQLGAKLNAAQFLEKYSLELQHIKPAQLLAEIGFTPAEQTRLLADRFNFLFSSLSKNLQISREYIPAATAEIITDILDSKNLLTPGVILTGITERELEQLLLGIYRGIVKSQTLDKLLEKVSLSIEEKINRQGIEAFLNRELLINDLLQLKKDILTDPVKKKEISQELTALLSEIAPALITEADRATLNQLLQIFIDGLFTAIENNLLALMESIDIRQITESEVNRMDPRQLEEMFCSFAGGYFKKIESYGWFGSLIGLAVELLEGLI